MFDAAFYKRIQDALGTAEEGEALIEVARNAHKAEQELAALKRMLKEEDTGIEMDEMNGTILVDLSND